MRSQVPEGFSRRDVLLLIALAILVALFFWRILTPNPGDRAQFPPGDFTDQFYAFRLYEARAFAEGRLPLWCENINSGHPFLADVQAAVFYPIGLANTLLNVALFGSFSLFALELEAILHVFLAGAFTYVFARRIIGSRAGAFASALVFMFGGYLTSYPPLQLAILETATWLPLGLYWLDRAADETPATRSAIFAGIVLGVAALAGHPQTFSFVLGASLIYFLYRSRSNAPLGRRATIVRLGVVLLVAFGLAAAQWIPTLEYQQLSTREALSFREAGAGLPTLDLLQFILPGYTSAFASPLYVGVLPLWLTLLAVARRERGPRLFWGVLAVGALILAFGFYVFGYVLVYLFVPGAVLFRQQERLALVVSFALAILAGFGLHDLLRLGSSSARNVARRLYVWLPSGGAISFALLITFFAAGAQSASGRLAFLGDRAGLMLLLFGLAAALVGAYLSRRLSPSTFVGFACALVLFDLFSVNEPANKAAPVERFPETSLVARVRQDQGLFRVANEGQLPGHMGIAYQLEEIGGISPLRLARYDRLLKLAPEKVWPLLGVRYVFTDRSGIPNASIVSQEGNTRLLRIDQTLGRAWLVGVAQVEPDDARALALIQSHDFDPARTAVLSSTPPFPLNSSTESGGSINYERRTPEHLILTVNAPSDQLLVVSENFYPGWTARVDGATVEILRADVNLRAVPMRAGSHRVEFIYDPWSVKIGLSISLLTLLGCVFIALTIRRRG